MGEFPNPPILSAEPTDGQVPRYNATTNEWDPGTPAGATGPTGATGATGATGSVSPQAINAQTGTAYTLVLGDLGKLVSMNNAAANTLTVPTNASVAFATGTVIDLLQLGAGKTTVAAAGGVTVSSVGGNLSLGARYARARLEKIASDTWVLTGGDALIA